MKSVGLLQMMVQSGLLVPVHELSEFGVFLQIFADIGDQQSLDRPPEYLFFPVAKCPRIFGKSHPADVSFD